MDKPKKTIKSFKDLDVYQNTYNAMIEVFKYILPNLPKEEQYDLKDQLRRSVKAIPRLIAEGHSKRHQKRGFQKYLDDAMAESNETIVSLCQARDLYPESIDTDKASRQLYKLSLAWTEFSKYGNKRNRTPHNETSSDTD
jgi:four helix bundle protein